MACKQQDHWTSKAYNDAASFVPKLTTKIVQYLSPQPGEQILDLGCGDGILTAQIGQTVSLDGGKVVGLDASPSMISAAQSKFTTSNCTFHVQNCTTFSPSAQKEFLNGTFDKVFSNAALHWILRSPTTRLSVLRSAFQALKPGGSFVFEMGGHGNVADAHTALIAALIKIGGFTPVAAREKSPWFFPSVDWMRSALTEVGFEAEFVEIEYRPTKMTERDADGKGGLEGWVRLMGAPFLEGLEPQKLEEVVTFVCECLEGVVGREEDRSQWLGYVRLRCVARKSAASSS